MESLAWTIHAQKNISKETIRRGTRENFVTRNWCGEEYSVEGSLILLGDLCVLFY